MVNLQLQTMDDYGLIEPTDVGTISISYDSKDDIKRKINRWDQEETIFLLNLIKENDFVGRYSCIKMSTLLSEMMSKKGYQRTDKQIQVKLTTLRKNYLTYARQKINNSYVKECPFFKELNDIYGNADSTNGYDSSDECDINGQDECLINFPDDPTEWTKAEVQKMLNQIKSMKLKNEITLTFFSPVAMKMIAEAMQKSGYDRSTNSVKNALVNLRRMYIDYKVKSENNENPPEFIFYSTLDGYWGKDFKKHRLKEKRKMMLKSEEPWSTEETIVLLTLIQDLNIADEVYGNSEDAAEDLRLNLAENDFTRTKQQVIKRLIQLKRDFANVHTTCSEADAVRKFPFYNLYKKLFETQFMDEVRRARKSSSSSRDSLDYAENGGHVKAPSQNCNVYWANEEVRILLKTVQEMTSKSRLNDSLEDEKLQRIVKVLSEAGYQKTAEQIKAKLALLKSLYLKCNQEDSTEKDIFNCPFYNELHNIFHTPVSDQRYEFIKNLLAENMDLSSTKFSDHSYTNNTNVKFGNGSLGTDEKRVNDKVTVVPNKCIDTWFPVESIIEDDGISPSTTLELNNISAISNQEHEQEVEDAILANLSHSSGHKVENNRTIAEYPSLPPDLNNVNLDDRIPAAINEVALDQEVETTTAEENDANNSKIYLERPESQVSANLSMSLPLPIPGEDDGQPPCKKPRIIEDERIGKNRILLRPVEKNPTSMNISKPTSKFVRLIVANDRPNNRSCTSTLVNHITAHIEPLSVNVNAATSSSTVSSELNSPVDKVEATKIAAEKSLKEDVLAQRLQGVAASTNRQENVGWDTGAGNNSQNKISQTIKDVVQTMMKHDEVMQQRHHAWMEQQFEIQRKHEEEQKSVMIKELQELRKCIAVLIASNVPHANNQRR